MKPIGESPKRLIDDPELGEIVRELQREVVPPATLTQTGHRLAALIVATPALTPAVAKVVTLATVLKVAVPIAVGATTAAVILESVERREHSPTPPALESPAVRAAPPAEPLPDGRPSPEPAPRRTTAAKAVHDVPAPAATQSPAPSARGQLAEQLEIYERARAARRGGDITQATAAIDELLRRFPDTPLAAEAQLDHAALLAQAGEVEQAIVAVRALLVDQQHEGRRAELWQWLGDLYARHGDCPHATEAYGRAIAAGLERSDRDAAQRGIERCAQ